MHMIEILGTYDNGQPSVLRWFRDDGTEMISYLKYEEIISKTDEFKSYVVWGTIFHMDTGRSETISQRFFSKEYAEAFYQKLVTKYPQSRVNLDKCIPVKEYY